MKKILFLLVLHCFTVDVIFASDELSNFAHMTDEKIDEALALKDPWDLELILASTQVYENNAVDQQIRKILKVSSIIYGTDEVFENRIEENKNDACETHAYDKKLEKLEAKIVKAQNDSKQEDLPVQSSSANSRISLNVKTDINQGAAKTTGEDDVLSIYPVAGVIIIALVAVGIYAYRNFVNAQKKNNDIDDQHPKHSEK